MRLAFVTGDEQYRGKYPPPLSVLKRRLLPLGLGEAPNNGSANSFIGGVSAEDRTENCPVGCKPMPPKKLEPKSSVLDSSAMLPLQL